MAGETVSTSGAPRATGPYSQGITANEWWTWRTSP
jgi:hypothetical protein